MELIPAVFLPLFIFFARILDVSIGTIRIIFVSKGLKGKAALLGFLEVLIWIIIVGQIFQNLDSWFNYVAYAGGFSAGTYIGMYLEEKIKMGVQIFRIIITKDKDSLPDKLKEAGFRVTVVDGVGKFGPVKVLLTIAKRKRWQELADLVSKHAPDAFYSVEDVKHVSLLDEEINNNRTFPSRLMRLRKGI